MDPSRDKPFTRFTTFWWGLGTFLIFAVVLGVIYLFNKTPGENLEEKAAEARYATKQEMLKVQAAELTPEQIQKAIAPTAKTLASSKPVAVEKPEQIVPGSATANKLASEGPVDTTAIDAASAAAEDAPIDPAVMEIGKAQYLVCGACHGQNGEGTAAGPPLAESDWVSGPVSNLIRIQLRGLAGPITVSGKEYNFPAGMAPLAYQTDEQIAGVLTYIRNSFGNKASAVTAEQVAPLRGEVGKPQLSVDELTKP